MEVFSIFHIIHEKLMRALVLGWPPHVHFQLSYQKPTTHDLIGVCSEEEREKNLKIFPDPQLVLGRLY